MAAIAARMALVWRTVIEERTRWRRSRLMSLADQNPESIRKGELAAGAGAAQAGHQFVDGSEAAAGGVGRALAQPGVQHLAA
jgi:hypothetical protein